MVKTAAIALCLACLPALGIAYDIGQHLWQHRLLFLVADHPDDAALRDQRRAITHRSAAIDERHLRVFELFTAGQGSVDGRPLTAQDVARLRDALGVKAGDRQLILVGKDGGIKRRDALDTPIDVVFEEIDGMPMRRTEMREQRGRND